MVVVKYFNNTPSGPAEIMQHNFRNFPEALMAARRSGTYFDLCDTRSGRTFTWEECTLGEDDGWYYDESEALWKKANSDPTE
jgi:hypothetical protein